MQTLYFLFANTTGVNPWMKRKKTNSSETRVSEYHGRQPVVVYLLRHGQDEDNKLHILNGHRDSSLTEQGKIQAAKAAEKLKNQPIDLILTSPLKRAKETAEIINIILNKNLNINPGLVERDYGVLTGKNSEEKFKLAKELISTEKITFFYGVESSEEFPQVLERAKKVLNQIKNNNKNTLLVSHGDFLQMFRAAYFGWNWREALNKYYLGNGETIVLDKGKEYIL